MKELWQRLVKWNAEADANNFLYNIMHLFFWGIAFGVFMFLVS